MTPDRFTSTFGELARHVETELRGKGDEIEKALICFFARGHLLIEDVPGVGKTLLARTLSASLEGAVTRRVQGTPDLLPSDIQGAAIYHKDEGTFGFQQGPVFTNILHCDEINRIPPRTQAALLQAMEERQVTVLGTARDLLDPFFVIATQNPIEMFGTFPLPEAQLDRFLMRINLGYPTELADEIAVMRDFSTTRMAAGAVLPIGVVPEMIASAEDVWVAEALLGYVAELVRASRERSRLGASPRAGLALVRAARVLALARGRQHVLPEDITTLADAVLAHRLVPFGESGADAQHKLVAELLNEVPPPHYPPNGRHR